MMHLNGISAFKHLYFVELSLILDEATMYPALLPKFSRHALTPYKAQAKRVNALRRHTAKMRRIHRNEEAQAQPLFSPVSASSPEIHFVNAIDSDETVEPNNTDNDVNSNAAETGSVVSDDIVFTQYN